MHDAIDGKNNEKAQFFRHFVTVFRNKRVLQNAMSPKAIEFLKIVFLIRFYIAGAQTKLTSG